MNFRRALTPFRLAVAGILVIVVAAILIVTTTNAASSEFLLVPDRAHPLAGLVKVPGARPHDSRGGVYYVDVLERKASLFDRIFPPKGSTVIRQSQLTPPGVSEEQRIKADRLDMRLSQQVATAVALDALGYKVRVRQIGVRVALVYGQTHAVGKLQPGDVIVAADGTRVHSTLQLHNLLGRHRVGDTVSLVFLRDGVRHHVRIVTSRDPDPLDHGRAIIGFQPQPAIDLHVPFTIKFDLGGVGGPSAGLAFALEILEQRGRDVDHGYKVAATGTIAPDGSVGQIGAVQQKAIGARAAHVDVFLVPAGDNYRVARKYAGSVRVIPVQTFQQALHALATLPPKR
jgi:PDZ domain-containing protein